MVLLKVAKNEASTGFPLREWLDKQQFRYEFNGTGIKILGVPRNYVLTKDSFGYKIVTKAENEMVADVNEDQELSVRPEYWLKKWKDERRIKPLKEE